MRSVGIWLLLPLALLISLERCGAQSSEAVNLNNEGVNALKRVSRPHGYAQNLKDRDWQSIFDKFESALRIDPTFSDARKNLAVAHNNFALYLASSRQKPAESLKQFHESLYIDPDESTERGMEVILRGYFRINPNSFSDRVLLGDQARTNGDLLGAVVEYRAALKLKDDPEVHKKLGAVSSLLDDKDKAGNAYNPTDKGSEK
jgi:tetratricopeptide (TPR) repeat protein